MQWEGSFNLSQTAHDDVRVKDRGVHKPNPRVCDFPKAECRLPRDQSAVPQACPDAQAHWKL